MDMASAARTDPPPADVRRTVLFDFDGVLLRGDAFELFVRARLRRSRGRMLLALAFAAPLLPLLLLWPKGSLARRGLARAAVAAVLLGQAESRYRALATDFGVELARQPGRFQREALTAFRRHLAVGDRVLVVTGCEDTLARSILDELGLRGTELLASRLRAGALGLRVAHHNVGARKLKSLAAAGLGNAWDRAYSDSAADLPMLRAAREPVLVNATPKLCRRVERALGRAVERIEWY